jgi:hypothetical protein
VKAALAALALLTAQPVMAQQAAPTRSHVLQGMWKINWLDMGKSSEMQITDVIPGVGVTHLTGALADPDGARCTVEGDVYDTLAASFANGPEQKTLRISAYVVIRGTCAGGRQLWIEALGLPSGPFLINGRATNISSQGMKAVFPVALGR